MWSLILSNSPAKLDHRRPGDNVRGVGPLPMPPIPPRQGRNVTPHNNQATRSTATNKPGIEQPRTSSNASVPNVCAVTKVGRSEAFRALLYLPAILPKSMSPARIVPLPVNIGMLFRGRRFTRLRKDRRKSRAANLA